MNCLVRGWFGIVALLPALALGAPTLDAGSAYPLSTTASNSALTTISRASVTTNAAGLIVVAVTANSQTNTLPFTVSGAGLSWSPIKQMTWQAGQAYPGSGTAEIWAAWSSSGLSSQTITATRSAGPSMSAAITVWAYTATTVQVCFGNVLSCFGSTGGKQQDASATVDATMTVANSSVLIGAFMEGANGSGITALANTTWRATLDDAGYGCTLRTGDAGGTGGSVTIGSSSSTTFVATAAAEILARAQSSPPRSVGKGRQTPYFNPNPGPLTTAGGNRYMLDRWSQPFPVLGDAGWGAAIFLNAVDRAHYLDDRKARGFNTIEIMLVGRHNRFASPPADVNGNQPFTKRLDGAPYTGSLSYSVIANEAADFTTSNEPYWKWIDQFISEAAKRGMIVAAFPAYTGYQCNTTEGWMPEMVANGNIKMFTYGAWVANRYKYTPNIIWMLGGDCGTGGSYTGGMQGVEEALANGLKSVSTSSTQYSAEWSIESIGPDIAAVSSILANDLTLNNAYSWSDIYTISRSAFSSGTAHPAFVQETLYEGNGSGFSPWRQNYWISFLGTIGGYIFGNETVWPFSTGWITSLDDPGTRSVAVLNRFIRSIPWWTLLPDGLGGMGTIITAGNSSPDRARVVYSGPTAGATFTFDSTKMSGNYRARWLDPTSGDYTLDTASIANTGTHVFTVPAAHADGFDDWALVLDR
jgi:hypothetical protein